MGQQPDTDLKTNFNNLVFFDAVRNHPDFHLDAKVARELKLDTARMLETHQLRVRLYAQMMELNIEQAEAEIMAAATVYAESLETARQEWEKLLMTHKGEHWVAGPKATEKGRLIAFCTSGGMSAAQAVAFLCWSTI